MKEIKVNIVVTVPNEITENDFWNVFTDWIDKNRWSYGGGIEEVKAEKSH